MQKPPRNVGIHAIEIYFPKSYISQAELEEFSNVPKGKYTIGLGQINMSFVYDFEDANSMALTVVQSLLDKFNVDPRSIGRLEVGTETLVDKSKSTKTILMQLFSRYENYDIEGVTSINACYGGTNALFNTINWVQSESWDGRFGIVVTTDVAVYAKGPARPTGGAGAIAILIGPDAPIVMESIRNTFIDHQYDFYKPDMTSEFPLVDGQLSVENYQKALFNCYMGLKLKLKNKRGEDFNLDKIDYCCFHTPFCKMVAKSFEKLFEIDFKYPFSNVFFYFVRANSLFGKGFDKNIQSEETKTKLFDSKTFSKLLQEYWDAKVLPSLYFSMHLGNIYTGSLYANLISLITDLNINLENKRILMFSYGSGLASSIFLLKCNANLKFIRDKIQARERLQQRKKVPCEVYDNIMLQRISTYNKAPIKPEIYDDLLFEGTFYLEKIDNKYRRFYVRKISLKPVLTINQIKEVYFSFKVRLTNKKNKEKNKISENKTLRTISILKNHLSKSSEQVEKEEKEDFNQSSNLLWTGFHKKTFKERLDHLKKLDPTLSTEAYESGGLSIPIADIMVENCIGKLSLPMGVGLNFQINGKFYQVPMVVEEPSVIAACSASAKFISENCGGFKAFSTDAIMRGQMQILDCDCQIAIFIIENHKKEIIEFANQSCQNMVNRGGGVIGVVAKAIPIGNHLKMVNPHLSDMLIVELMINVCESMGANIINTVVEHTAPYVVELVGGRPGIKILTNLCPERKAMAFFEIPIEKMRWKQASGEEVSKRIMEAYLFAKHDVYRAVTHNKGIMNGIDAAAIATGQDWRAIEAAAHAYSEIKYGKYQPLTQYSIKKNIDGQLFFRGSIELPISLGTVGGVVQNNPVYKNNMKMLGYPNSKDLSQILVCVGLANNFAAMRALAIEGIQKGHMNLHAKNIALSAGVPHYLAMDAVEFMKSIGRISKDSAKAYLEAIDLYAELRPEGPKENENLPSRSLSTFFVEIYMDSLPEPIILNVALDCLSDRALHLTIEKNPRTKRTQQDINIQKQLFGDKGYEWLSSFFHELDLIKFSATNGEVAGSNSGKSQELCYKLKTLSILINILSSSLVKMNFHKVLEIYQIIKDNPNSQVINDLLKDESITLKYGCFLLAELIKITQYNLELVLPFQQLKGILLNELFTIIESHFRVSEIWVEAIQNRSFNFDNFLNNRRKRLSATMMLYCDALMLKNTDIIEPIIQKMKVLGEIFEIEGTMVRDVSKWPPNEGEINLYSYWLYMKGLYKEGGQQIVKKQFLKNVMNISKQKKNCLDSGLIDQYKVTKEVMQRHYGVNEKILSSDAGDPKL